MPLLQEPHKSGAGAWGSGEDNAAGLQREVKLANISEHPPVLTVALFFLFPSGLLAAQGCSALVRVLPWPLAQQRAQLRSERLFGVVSCWTLREMPTGGAAEQDGSLPGGYFAGAGCWPMQHGADTGPCPPADPVVPLWCPRPAHSPGSRWGPPLAPAPRGPSPSPRKKARPPRKSRLFGCHLLPVISASRRAVPTLSWPFPTYVPITGWAGGEGRPPGAAPSAPPDLSPCSGEIYGLRQAASNPS